MSAGGKSGLNEDLSPNPLLFESGVLRSQFSFPVLSEIVLPLLTELQKDAAAQ